MKLYLLLSPSLLWTRCVATLRGLPRERVLQPRVPARGLAAAPPRLRVAPAAEVPRGPSGEDLRATVFAVRKDEAQDRSILNRQRRNAVEERVDGVTPTFPHGSQLGEFALRPWEKLRISADDLPA